MTYSTGLYSVPRCPQCSSVTFFLIALYIHLKLIGPCTSRRDSSGLQLTKLNQRGRFELSLSALCPLHDLNSLYSFVSTCPSHANQTWAKIFTNLGCLFSTLWWSPSKKAPTNYIYPISAIWQLMGPCGGYEGQCLTGPCALEVDGIILKSKRGPSLTSGNGLSWNVWSMILHTNRSSECSCSQKAKRILGFIKRNIDNKTENNISLLWKNWWGHISRSKGKFKYFSGSTQEKSSRSN